MLDIERFDRTATIKSHNVFGGFMNVDIDMDFRIWVPSNEDALHVEVTANRTVFSKGASSGSGFINVSAMCWGDASFDLTDPVPVSANGEWPETWPEVKARTGELTGGLTTDQCVYGVYSSDLNSNVKGTWSSSTSHVWQLTEDDIDRYGVVKDRRLVTLMTRSAAGPIYHVMTDRNHSLSLTLSSSEWPYKPFAYAPRWGGGYPVMGFISTNAGGSTLVQRRDGGGWDDMTNDLYRDALSDVLILGTDGQWRRSPRFRGTKADPVELAAMRMGSTGQTPQQQKGTTA